MHAFPATFLNGQRLDQHVNMVGHHAGDEAFDFFCVPVMACIERGLLRCGREFQIAACAPGDVIDVAGNLEVRKQSAAGGGFGDAVGGTGVAPVKFGIPPNFVMSRAIRVGGR